MDLGWCLDEDLNTVLLRVVVVLAVRDRSLSDRNPKQCLRNCRGNREGGWSLRQKTNLKKEIEVVDGKTK